MLNKKPLEKASFPYVYAKIHNKSVTKDGKISLKTFWPNYGFVHSRQTTRTRLPNKNDTIFKQIHTNF